MTRAATPIPLRLTQLAFSVVVLAFVLVSLGFGALADAKTKDRNRNGIPDRWERKHGLSTKRDLSRRDNDRDGLTNRSEYRSGTNPRKVDTDVDGLDDADEDRDGDRVDNGNEQRQRTRQNDRDSDNDGRSDGREDRDSDGLLNAGEDSSANDPIDDDSDDDGTEDGDENSGVVASFDGTTLVIDRDIGGQASGTVDGTTRVTCEDEDGHEALQGGLSARFRSAEDELEVRGVITSIGGTSFVIQLREGGSQVVDVDGSTQFRAPDRDSSGAVGLDDLRVGDRVEAEIDIGSGVATEVQVDEPEDGPGEDGEELKGRITAIGGNEITIEGRFGQVTVIQVDPSTYLVAPDRDNSGSVTIDDLRVGDRVEAKMPLSGDVASSVKVEDMEDPNDEDGYEDGEDGDAEEHDGGACPVDLLIPGVRVHEAELSTSGVFLEIEIVAPDDGDTDVEDAAGQVTGVSGNSVTIIRAATGTEVTLLLRPDAVVRCKSLYGGKPVSCNRSEIAPGVLVHEFQVGSQLNGSAPGATSATLRPSGLKERLVLLK